MSVYFPEMKTVKSTGGIICLYRNPLDLLGPTIQLGTVCIHLWLDHEKTSACSNFQEHLLTEVKKMWMFIFLVNIPLKVKSGNKALSGLAMTIY